LLIKIIIIVVIVEMQEFLKWSHIPSVCFNYTSDISHQSVNIFLHLIHWEVKAMSYKFSTTERTYTANCRNATTPEAI